MHIASRRPTESCWRRLLRSNAFASVPANKQMPLTIPKNGESVIANSVNILPCDLGGDMASVSLDAPVGPRHQEYSWYRHGHACCTGGRPIGSDRGHGACRRCVSSTAPGATELAHARICDRCSLWPGTSIPNLKVAVMSNPRCTGREPRNSASRQCYPRSRAGRRR
jgi:hypothetical protein